MAQFTAEQRQKIEHFKDVTSIQSDDVAQFALSKTDWNVPICIQRFFENPDAFLSGDSRAVPASNPNNTDVSQAAQAAGADAGSGSGSGSGAQESQEAAWSEYLGYIPGLSSLGSYLASWLDYVSSFLYAPQPSMPYAEVVRQFERHNEALRGVFAAHSSFAAFLSSASARDECMALLFVPPNASNASNASALSAECVVQCVRGGGWAWWLGDERNADGRALYASVTQQFSEQRRPLLVVGGVHPTSGKLVLAHRQYIGHLRAPSDAAQLLQVLQHGRHRWHSFKRQQIARMAQLHGDRDLRQAQDREFQRLLRQEQEQQRQQQRQQQMAGDDGNDNDNDNEEEAKQTEPEEKQADEAMQRVRAAKERITALQTERDGDGDGDGRQLLRVALRMPDGRREQMMFAEHNCVASLFDFALSEEPRVDGQLIDDIELVRSYPKRIFSQKDAPLTLLEAGIESNTLLIVN